MQVRESAKTGDEQAARKLLRKRTKLAITPHFIPPRVERVTFDSLATMYLTDYTANRPRSLDPICAAPPLETRSEPECASAS